MRACCLFPVICRATAIVAQSVTIVDPIFDSRKIKVCRHDLKYKHIITINGDMGGGVGNLNLQLNIRKPVNDCGARQISKEIWTSFLRGFDGGLPALLTPCIFPLIQVTGGYFTAKAITNRQGICNSLVYGFFILFMHGILLVSLLLNYSHVRMRFG